MFIPHVSTLRRRLPLLAAAIVTLTVGGLAAPAGAADAIGRVKVVSGDARIMSGGTEKEATVGAPILAEDVLRTGPAGRMGVTFVNSTRFAVGPGSEVSVSEFSFDSTTHEGRFDSRIDKGSLAVISGKIAKADQAAMTLRTPTSVLGVRGTSFIVEVK